MNIIPQFDEKIAFFDDYTLPAPPFFRSWLRHVDKIFYLWGQFQGLYPRLERMKSILLMTFLSASLFGCGAQCRFDSVNLDHFKEHLKEPQLQLVDVRTAEEYRQGHIPGAINIDLLQSDFERQILHLDPAHKVAIYCRSGRRSKEAARRLSDAGYRVVELSGGINSWDGALAYPDSEEQ